jgi:hypothetical protein
VSYRQSLVLRWVDANGGTRAQALNTIANPAPALGTLAAVRDAIAAASHAGLLYAKLDPIAVYAPVPTTGPYQTCMDYLSMQFRTSAGTSVKINIPAPKVDLFLAGHERMDPTAGLVVAIRDAVFAAVSDSNGNPVNQLVSGMRCKLSIPPAYGS